MEFIIIDFTDHPTVCCDENGIPIAFSRKEALSYAEKNLQKDLWTIVQIPRKAHAGWYLWYEEGVGSYE